MESNKFSLLRIHELLCFPLCRLLLSRPVSFPLFQRFPNIKKSFTTLCLAFLNNNNSNNNNEKAQDDYYEQMIMTMMIF